MKEPSADVEITGVKRRGEWTTFEGRTKDGRTASVDIHSKNLQGRNAEAFIKRSIQGIADSPPASEP